MRRVYEFFRFLFKEKVNVFIKGAVGGWVFSGVLLFGGNITSTRALVVTYILKVFAVSLSGLITGFATVLGNDLYHLAKAKVLNKRKTIKKRQNRKTA